MKFIKLFCVLAVVSVAIFFLIRLNYPYKQPFDGNTGQSQKITEHGFVSRIFDNDLNYKNLEKIYLPKEITEETLKNEPNNAKLLSFQTDTGDKIVFYKTDYTISPNNIIFVSDKIVLDGDIKIGINKSVLEKKINKKIFMSEITVSNIDGYINLTFFFEKDILVKIIFNSEYLD